MSLELYEIPRSGTARLTQLIEKLAGLFNREPRETQTLAGLRTVSF